MAVTGPDAAAPSTSPVRVLQITDPHLFADRAALLRGTVTCDSLSNVLARVRDAAWQPDVIAMTGDVVQDDSRGGYEIFRELLTPLGLPVYCVPGNHDVEPTIREILGREPFRYCAAREHGNWLIAGVDSHVPGSAAGFVAAAELDRIESQLRSTAAEHAAVCLHHQPLPIGSRWLDEVGLGNGEEFLRRIAAPGNVRLVVFGHVHQAFEGGYASIRILGTPSTGSQFKPGSETFTVDDRPPAYRRLTLHPDGRVDTRVVWLESGPDGGESSTP